MSEKTLGQIALENARKTSLFAWQDVAWNKIPVSVQLQAEDYAQSLLLDSIANDPVRKKLAEALDYVVNSGESYERVQEIAEIALSAYEKSKL